MQLQKLLYQPSPPLLAFIELRPRSTPSRGDVGHWFPWFSLWKLEILSHIEWEEMFEALQNTNARLSPLS